MPDKHRVASHYAHGSLLDAIRQGVQQLGKTEDTVTLEDLGPVEEFHTGGRQASAEFLDQLNLTPTDHVLDVGCGLGGVSRFAASTYGCRVTGVDLTKEFVETGRVLNAWVNLDDRIDLQEGSALAMTCADAHFDQAFMMHVGMNIADKAGLMKEVYRVLKPGGRFGIFDIMQTSEGELTFPVPWASEASGSSLASPAEYKAALEAAGFKLVAERNRHDFAKAFFETMKAKAAASSGPAPLGLHIVMGANASQKIANTVESVELMRIAPVELIAEKAS